MKLQISDSFTRWCFVFPFHLNHVSRGKSFRPSTMTYRSLHSSFGSESFQCKDVHCYEFIKICWLYWTHSRTRMNEPTTWNSGRCGLVQRRRTQQQRNHIRKSMVQKMNEWIVKTEKGRTGRTSISLDPSRASSACWSMLSSSLPSAHSGLVCKFTRKGLNIISSFTKLITVPITSLRSSYKWTNISEMFISESPRLQREAFFFGRVEKSHEIQDIPLYQQILPWQVM